MIDFIGFIGVILIMLGGSGVMNEQGDLQIIPIAMALIGAIVILIVANVRTKR